LTFFFFVDSVNYLLLLVGGLTLKFQVPIPVDGNKSGADVADAVAVVAAVVAAVAVAVAVGVRGHFTPFSIVAAATKENKITENKSRRQKAIQLLPLLLSSLLLSLLLLLSTAFLAHLLKLFHHLLASNFFVIVCLFIKSGS